MNKKNITTSLIYIFFYYIFLIKTSNANVETTKKNTLETNEIAQDTSFNQYTKNSNKIKLTGIVKNTNKKKSIAILEYNKEQNIYTIGDSINNEITIKSIENNYIYASDRQNNIFKLELNNNVDNFQESKHPCYDSSSSEEKSKKITYLMDVINLSPIYDKNMLIGYQIGSSNELSQMTSLGLQPNDLAIRINDIDLKQEHDINRIIQELISKRDFSIRLERDGIEQDIFISLP